MAASYSGEKLKEAIADIARKDYGIDHCDVRIEGTTLGVFLPLSQLFAVDFKEAILSGKVTDMDGLFQPTEEAIRRIEDMLFSISRVILSTDKKIDFYYLQATDTDKTGMELTFLGHSDDIKRVRFWDIPRSEYRKRMIHEIQLNRAVLWHKPVRRFFSDLNEKTRPELALLYFKDMRGADWGKEFFFTDTSGNPVEKGSRDWEILDIRSLSVQDQEVVAYAKVKAVSRGRPGAFVEKEYLFRILATGDKEELKRIIPMDSVEQVLSDVSLPMTKEMIYDSLDRWDTEFEVPDMTMGDFLALQLTRRSQMLISQDERIYNTFSGVKVVLKYDPLAPKHFAFFMTAPLKDIKQASRSLVQGVNEDVIYLWELMTREFVEVMRGYRFEDWDYLSFSLTQAQSFIWKADRADLELFRRKKKGIRDILSVSAV